MNFTLNALDLATCLAKLTRLLLWDVHALSSLLGPWSALINWPQCSHGLSQSLLSLKTAFQAAETRAGPWVKPTCPSWTRQLLILSCIKLLNRIHSWTYWCVKKACMMSGVPSLGQALFWVLRKTVASSWSSWSKETYKWQKCVEDRGSEMGGAEGNGGPRWWGKVERRPARGEGGSHESMGVAAGEGNTGQRPLRALISGASV